MPDEPDLNTPEGRLTALRDTGLLTAKEYEFAMRHGLDITDNIPFKMAETADLRRSEAESRRPPSRIVEMP
jgi:hypothetical protein